MPNLGAQKVPPFAPDPWLYYLDEATLQYAAHSWPPARFLEILFSESTESVKILETGGLGFGKPINFEVTGRCFQKVPAAFHYELIPAEMTNAEKMRVKDFIKILYAKEKNLGYPTARKIARALGVAL